MLGKWGVCMPAVCSNADIFELFNYLLPNQTTEQLTVSDVKCLERPPLKWKTEALILLLILGLIALVALFGTILDVLWYKPNVNKLPEKKIYRVELSQIGSGNSEETMDILTKAEFYDSQNLLIKMVLCFSLYTNGKKILDTTLRPGQIDCLHGLRFFSMCWIILYHTISRLQSFGDNYSDLTKSKDIFVNLVCILCNISVDNFFVLSGLLLSYLWLKEMRKTEGKKMGSRYTWLMYYLHRYIRLTPVYLIIVACETLLISHVTRGPFSIQPGRPDYENCKNHWWANLLYVNNIVYAGRGTMCRTPTWYLANDMQFHVLAPALLIPLFYFPQLGFTASVILIIISMGINSWECFYMQLPLGIAFTEAFVPPFHTVIGMIFGYWMVVKPKEENINKFTNAILWITVAVSLTAVVFCLMCYSQRDYPIATWQIALYSAVSRPLWSLGIGLLIFACFTGSGRIVNDLLSWPLWMPLSRLTYCAYLLQFFAIDIVVTGLDSPLHWTNILNWMLTIFLPVFVLTYVISFFASATLELPVLSLEKIIIQALKTGSHENKKSAK